MTRVLGRLAQAGVEVPIWQAKLLTRLEPTLVRKIHVGRFRFTRGMTPYNVLETLSGPALVDKQLRISLPYVHIYSTYLCWDYHTVLFSRICQTHR